MDLSPGQVMLCKTSFVSDNDKKLDYSKGQRLELVDAVEAVSVATWVMCRAPSGEPGLVKLENIEPELSEDELQQQLTTIEGRLGKLVETVQGGSSVVQRTHLEQLFAFSRCHTRVASLLLTVHGVILQPLIAFATSEGPEGSDNLEQLQHALVVLTAMYRADEEGTHVQAAIANSAALVSALWERAALHHKGEPYSKATRSIATASMKLIDAIAESEHYRLVATKEHTSLILDMLADKENNVHCLPSNGRGYHLPSAVRYFVELAGHSECHAALLAEHPTLLQVLEGVSSATDSHVAKDLAQGAVLLLKAVHRQQATSASGHVFISYNWRHQELALKVKRGLEDNGYSIWIDTEKMEGNIVEQMATAVEGAAVVLMFYSVGYSKSKNCMLEAQYVSQLGVDFIPVFVEPNCEQIRGMLGILRGTKLYVDFSAGDFGTSLEALVKQLGPRGKGAPIQNAQLARKVTGATLPTRVEQLETQCKELESRLSEQAAVAQKALSAAMAAQAQVERLTAGLHNMVSDDHRPVVSTRDRHRQTGGCTVS
eukprot:m.392064 g.392064  ORF g.392064 m.392064 type:complete len:543 (-) comp20082_c1_seq19:323-1951(-)